MSTIPERISEISKSIQCAFEELVKLLLRKSINPVLNCKSNTVFNSFSGKYEKGCQTNDTVNKYNYIITNDSIGWMDEMLVNFKIVAKISVHKKICNKKDSCLNRSKVRVSFSEKEGVYKLITGGNTSASQYKNFISFFSSKSMQNIIANKKGDTVYVTDIPYSCSFKQLESIGKDIIEQTDPIIDDKVVSEMSTAIFRAKLFKLEEELQKLSIENPQIYDAYIEMIRIINSLPRNNTHWIIKFIATMNYQKWDDLSEKQKIVFIDSLGENFIDSFNSNALITILLQSNLPDLILSSSYLFALLKMLFIVFGYSKLVPIVIYQDEELFDPKKYKNSGAFQKRNHSIYLFSDRGPEPEFEGMYTKPEPDPVDPSIYDFIRLFGELYPTLIGLMGGTEFFPPENLEVVLGEIPPGYFDLNSIPEYLWRFNDFSYCRYLEIIYSKKISESLDTKVNQKAIELRNLN